MLGCIGIVAVGRVDGWKAYMGPVEGLGVGQEEDVIASLGAPLAEPEARAFFPNLKDRQYAQ